MSDICFFEDMILARAADPATGLNPMFAQFAQQFGIEQPSKYAIDFGDRSAQLLVGEVESGALDKTSSTKYPMFHLWVKSARDLQENKGGEFSGDVVAQIRLLLSWSNGSALRIRYDQLAKCFIAAMGSTFNRQIHPGWSFPAIALPFSFVRTPVEFGGDYWRQGILYTMPFIVDV